MTQKYFHLWPCHPSFTEDASRGWGMEVPRGRALLPGRQGWSSADHWAGVGQQLWIRFQSSQH